MGKRVESDGINPRQFPATLTFGRARSTQPHLLPARLPAHPSKEGWALEGCSDFLKPENRLNGRGSNQRWLSARSNSCRKCARRPPRSPGRRAARRPSPPSWCSSWWRWLRFSSSLRIRSSVFSSPFCSVSTDGKRRNSNDGQALVYRPRLFELRKEGRGVDPRAVEAARAR